MRLWLCSLFFPFAAFAAVDPSALSASVPILQPPGSVYPTLPCSIGGESGTCIFDSGSNISIVSQNPVSSRFGVVGTGTANTAHGTAQLQIVRANSFSVGHAIAATNVPVIRTNNYESLPAYLGVLGSDMLVHRNLVFDFARHFDSQHAQLIAPNSSQRKSLERLPFGKLVQSKKVVIQISVNGETINAVWDTHAPTTFSKSFIAKHPNWFSPTATVWEKDVLGNIGLMSTYQLNGTVELGGHHIAFRSIGEIDDRALHFDDKVPVAMVLGYDVISKLSWYFNPDEQRYAVLF